ncbi:MAG: hypothetical protein M3Q29_18365 [Chloroflexota bacterium]|nr:hypothetical protein [Chloroflexota bacterium]
MWQAQRFVGEQQERVLAELLTWLNENEDVIMEFQTVQVHEPDGTHVYVVSYRARSIDPHAYLA